MGTIYEYFKGINIESLSTRDIDLKSSSKKRKMSRNINSLKKPSRKIMKNDQYTLDFGQTQEKIVCKSFIANKCYFLDLNFIFSVLNVVCFIV